MTSKNLFLTITVAAIGHLCFGQNYVGNNSSIQPAQSRSAVTQQSSPQITQADYENTTLPNVSIKSNLLYDATASMNLGLEFRTGDKTSFEIPVTYNPWTFADNRKWKLLLIQPELRFWTDETFNGHFFGLHGHYAVYNVSKLRHPPFSEYMNTHRFQGWLAGAGLSYGYRWNFENRWGLEATIGVGYAYLSYDKFECDGCGRWLESETKNYFGPTKAGLTLIYNIGGGKKPKQTKYIPAPPVRSAPALTVSFIAPEVEAIKERSSEVGKAYLDFVVDRAEIMPNFRKNATELQRIQELIRQVISDPDATITNITVTGFASPEGSYSYNQDLSQRRANSFRNYIKSMYGLSDNLFTTYGAGEDWATLETLVSNSYLSDKYRALAIIQSSEPYDTRERKLKDLSNGRTYQQIFNEMYPALRRMECQVHYTVVPFTVEKGKQIFRTRPNNLSLNEMFLIAQTYPSGSAEYREVFETAARLFPQSDVANLNAAASALSRKDATTAADYLEKVIVQNTAYWNNYGVLLWLQGNSRKAIDCFAKGGATGAKNINIINNQ